MLMTSWLRNVRSNLRSSSRRARAVSRREKRPEALPSQVEMLEDRTLLSVVVQYAADLDDADIVERLQITTNNQFFDQKTCHYCLACARIVCQQEPQGLTRQHGFINRCDLVGQGIH